MAQAFNKFNQFVEDKNKGVHNVAANTLKAMLVNSPAPVATNSVKANLTEITSGFGYPAGGLTLVLTSAVQSGGVFKLIIADQTLTASGGTIGPFRYVVIYNDTPTSPADPLIGFYDYGSSISINDSESFVLDFDNTNGVYTDT